MIIHGSLKGFKKDEIEKHGFPIDGIQLCTLGDLVLDNEDFDIGFNTDVFLDICSAEYFMDGNVLRFKAKCGSIMLDGNETDLDPDDDLVYSIVRNSDITEVVLSGDYLDVDSKPNRKKLDRLKFLGSVCFWIGIDAIYRKSNKVNFY